MRYGDISTFQSGVAIPLFSLRSKSGVGIGEYLDVDPNVIRIIAVLLGCTGTGLIAYIIGAIILPEKP